MSDPTDLLSALRDVGVAVPAAGDAGDERVRAALTREIAGRPRARARRRLPFGAGRITLLPAVLAVSLATTAAAATVVLVESNYYQTRTPVMTGCEGAAVAAPTGVLLSCANTSVRELDNIRWHGWGHPRVTGSAVELTMGFKSFRVRLLLDHLAARPALEGRGALYGYGRLVITAAARPTVVLRLTTNGATTWSR